MWNPIHLKKEQMEIFKIVGAYTSATFVEADYLEYSAVGRIASLIKYDSNGIPRSVAVIPLEPGVYVVAVNAERDSASG
jgi:hypothetical protein